jgi:TP901 family phage tail tape measure protein
MAEDLSIKVKVEPDVSDLSNKLKTAGNGVAPIPVKISLANIGDIKNKIATLGTTVDVGVRLNNNIDIDSITSKLKNQTVEIAAKLNLDLDESEIGEIQTRLNEISKKLRLNLKVADKKDLTGKLEEAANKMEQSSDKIAKALEVKIGKSVRVTQKTISAMSSDFGELEKKIASIKDDDTRNRLSDTLTKNKESLNELLTAGTGSVLDLSAIQKDLSSLKVECRDVLATENQMAAGAKSMQDSLTRSADAVDNKLSKIKMSFASIDYGKFENSSAIEAAKSAYDEQLKIIATAKQKLDDEMQSDSVTKATVKAYKDAVAGLEDKLDSLIQKLTKVKSTLSGFDNYERRFKTATNKSGDADKGGYSSLMGDSYGNLTAAMEAARTAKNNFEKSLSTDDLKKYDDALYNLDLAFQNFSSNVNRAKNLSDNAFRSLPTVIEQLNSRRKSLLETNPKNDELKALAKDNGVYDNLIRKLRELNEKATGENGIKNYQDLVNIFQEFKGVGDKAGITINSLTSLMKALGIETRNVVSDTRQAKAAAQDLRNINTYEKSMQNTMYTAQRYFNANSKISTDMEAYAKFVDFFNTYGDKIKAKDFTQGNSNQMTKDWSELKKYIQDTGLETDKLSVKLKKLFGTNLASQLASQAINELRQGLQQVYQNVVDIDSAMTELKKVTDETSGAYSKFLSEAGDRAKNLGVSISDVVNATADFARLGYNLEEATQISDSAVMFKQVGDGVQSMDDATSDIISAMKAFNIEADKSLTITDRYNAVGNSFSITSAGVAEALKRSASSLHTAGNDIDQSIGMIVAANDVVQDPDSVGAGLRVIALRIRGATSELESMGEETDTVVKSTAKLQAEIKAISGVNILESDNATFKSTYQIMDELSAKWSQLSDIQKATLTDKIAGKNRANIFSSMMENWEDAKKAMETSKNSAGSATKELDTYLSSIEGKLSRFQATFQSFSSDVLDSGVVKGFIDMGTAALDFADGLVKAGDAMPTIATALSAVASMTNTKAGVNMPTYATGIAA